MADTEPTKPQPPANDTAKADPAPVSTGPTATYTPFETPHRGKETSVDIDGLSAGQLGVVRNTWDNLTGGRGGTAAALNPAGEGTSWFSAAMKPAEEERFTAALQEQGINLDSTRIPDNTPASAPTVTRESFKTPHRGEETSVDIRGLDADDLLTVRNTWDNLTGGRGGTVAGEDFSAPGTKQFSAAMKPEEEARFTAALKAQGINLGGDDGPAASPESGTPTPPTGPNAPSGKDSRGTLSNAPSEEMGRGGNSALPPASLAASTTSPAAPSAPSNPASPTGGPNAASEGIGFSGNSALPPASQATSITPAPAHSTPAAAASKTAQGVPQEMNIDQLVNALSGTAETPGHGHDDATKTAQAAISNVFAGNDQARSAAHAAALNLQEQCKRTGKTTVTQEDFANALQTDPARGMLSSAAANSSVPKDKAAEMFKPEAVANTVFTTIHENKNSSPQQQVTNGYTAGDKTAAALGAVARFGGEAQLFTDRASSVNSTIATRASILAGAAAALHNVSTTLNSLSQVTPNLQARSR